MPTRTRTRAFTEPRGYWIADFGTSGTETEQTPVKTETMQDFVEQGDCWPMVLERIAKGGCRLTTHYPHWIGTQFTDYMCDYMMTDSNFPASVTPSGIKSVERMAIEAIARSNPSRPYVDIPVALAELGDVAQLIRTTGMKIYGSLGDWNLRYQYGIKPLIGDLISLMNFRKAYSFRRAEILKLAGPLGYRKTMKMGKWTDNSGKYIGVVQSNQAYVESWVSRTTTYQGSAHARWRADDALLPILKGEDHLVRMVEDALLGLTLDKSTLWEALPWSWLIDWCSTIGTYFQAQRNIVPAVLEGIWLTRSHDHYWVIQGGKLDSLTLTPGFFERSTLVRSKAVTFVPTAHFPFLNGTQAGILASLAVMRM